MNSIREIVDHYLRRIKPTGNQNVMALCPFHVKSDGSEERNPSFAMNVYSGLWYCHSCHARGNLYTFLRDIGVPRSEIQLRYQTLLDEAEKYAPPKPDPLNPIEPTKEPLDESFLGLFDLCPNLLLEEGYPEDLLRKFDVGFDARHSRITFPLRDRTGRLVGISGRSVINARPRYKIYDKEYLAFGLPERATDKRAILWNVHNVLTQFAFETDPGQLFVVVVEGFKAVLRLVQAGVHTTVGLLGSYMSIEQEWMLSKLGCPILLMLDNNEAGRLGQRDAANRLVKLSHRLFIVDYDADQPSSLDPSLVSGALLRAQPYARWNLYNPL